MVIVARQVSSRYRRFLARYRSLAKQVYVIAVITTKKYIFLPSYDPVRRTMVIAPSSMRSASTICSTHSTRESRIVVMRVAYLTTLTLPNSRSALRCCARAKQKNQAPSLARMHCCTTDRPPEPRSISPPVGSMAFLTRGSTPKGRGYAKPRPQLPPMAGACWLPAT